MKLNSKSIGNKIAEARKKINLSQAELAQQISISSPAVGKWERGESLPDITTLNRLAEIFGVDLNFFSESFQSVSAKTTTVEPLEKQSVELISTDKIKNNSWDMAAGNWVDADFSGLKNLQKKFSSSNMQRCKFVGSNLSDLILKGNNIDNCNFSNSDISSSHIQGSLIFNNLFNDCSFKETEFLNSHIKGCDFTDVDFTRVLLKSTSLEKNIVANAVWNRTSFIAASISDIVFNGTLEDCSFENCGFTKTTFKNATIINTFFKNNKNLKKIKFIDCQTDRMTFGFLKSGKADLTGITLLTSHLTVEI